MLSEIVCWRPRPECQARALSGEEQSTTLCTLLETCNMVMMLLTSLPTLGLSSSLVNTCSNLLLGGRLVATTGLWPFLMRSNQTVAVQQYNMP